MAERRNFDARARLVQAIANYLRQAGRDCSAPELAQAGGGVPVDAARRVISRLAGRGLVRNVAADRWTAAMPLRCDAPPLIQVESGLDLIKGAGP